MLYAWLFPMHEQFHVLNVFRYITFRSVYAALTALALSFVLGPATIRFLKRLKVGQHVRSDGPQTHLKKSGTPTMGGILILASLAASVLLWARLDDRYVWMCLGAMLWFGMIGVWDDLAKLRARRSRGLGFWGKIAFQALGASLLMALYFATTPPDFHLGPALNIPFDKQPWMLPVWLYFVFGVVVIVGATNAVNLTDGLDGLAIGTSAVAAGAFVMACYLAGNFKFAEYLRIPFVPGVSEATVVCAALFGTCLGFLWFNSYPAQMFMGDTGALSIGGLLGTVAVVSKQEFFLLVVGGIFVMEALSVMIQVLGFKISGKRVFKMAPLHHHFELHGWEEPKVIVRFWILAIVLILLSLSTLKLR